jgi:hypothetical protein
MIVSPLKFFLTSFNNDSSDAPQNSMCDKTSFFGWSSSAIIPRSIDEVWWALWYICQSLVLFTNVSLEKTSWTRISKFLPYFIKLLLTAVSPENNILLSSVINKKPNEFLKSPWAFLNAITSIFLSLNIVPSSDISVTFVVNPNLLAGWDP